MDAELGRAAFAVEAMEKRTKELERSLASCIIAAGGKIFVPRDISITTKEFSLLVENRPDKNGVLWTARTL
jgi:hypothetical protein